MLQCDTVDPVIFKRNLNCYTAKLHGPGLIWGNWYNSVQHSIDIPNIAGRLASYLHERASTTRTVKISQHDRATRYLRALSVKLPRFAWIHDGALYVRALCLCDCIHCLSNWLIYIYLHDFFLGISYYLVKSFKYQVSFSFITLKFMFMVCHFWLYHFIFHFIISFM